VPLLPHHPLPEWSINLLYPQQRHPSTIVRTYLDFCQSYLPTIVQPAKSRCGMSGRWEIALAEVQICPDDGGMGGAAVDRAD